MANMGVDSLKGNLTNVARGYLWDVLVPVPIGNGDFNTYLLRAQTAEIPEVSSEVIHIPYKQTAGVDVNGRKTYSHTWSVSFIESEDHLTYDALYSWSQQLVDDVAGVGVGDPVYKTDVYLDLLKVDGSSYMKIKMKGAWIQTIGQVSLSYAVDGIITYPVTFRFDSIEKVTS